MVSKEDIKNLAELARLELSESEVVGLQKDISNILEYVGQVSAAAGESAQEVPSSRNVMRADSPRGENDPLLGKEETLRAAFPKREGDYNVVRKIIDKQSE